MNHDLVPTLADILLRGAVLLALAFVAALFLRRCSAALVRRFWRSTLAALLVVSALALIPSSFTFEVESGFPLASQAAVPPAVPPISSDRVPGSPVATLEDVLGLPPVQGSAEADSAAIPASTSAPRMGAGITLPLVLASLWLLGVLFLSGRKLVGALGARRLRRAAQPVNDPGWQRDLATLCDQCGIEKPIGLRVHLALRSPIVTGVFRPVIILPTDYSSYSPEDRRAVLLHELAHVRHRDALFRCFTTVARILHWPNPLAWHAERSLRLAEERASDDAVLLGGIAASNYAELLARLAKGGAPLVGDLGMASGSAMAQPSGLLQRVHAILSPGQARRRPGLLSSFLLFTTGIAAAVFLGSSSFLLAAPEEKKPATAPPKNASAPAHAASKMEKKLDAIVLPHVNFDGATLDEVLDYIRTRSRELDPAKEGINIVSRVPKPKVGEAGGIPPWEHLLKRRITLNLQEIPLRALLDFVGKITGTSYRASEYALIISLRDWLELETRNFRIPAQILERELAQGAGLLPAREPDPFGGGAGGDPFAEEGEPPAPPTISAIQWLRLQGVQFPEGTSAFYIKATGTLNIRNTPAQLEFVEHIVDSLNQRSSLHGMRKADAERFALLKKTLKETIVPSVDLVDAPLIEALEFVRSQTGTKGELNPVQFVYRVDAKMPTVTLKLTNVPAGVVIKHIADLARVRSILNPYGIEIRPLGQYENTAHLATFQLSAENLKKLHASMTDPPPAFPIAETLLHIGLPSSPEAGAFWNSATGDLIVRQTDSNLSRIASILEGLAPPPER